MREVAHHFQLCNTNDVTQEQSFLTGDHQSSNLRYGKISTRAGCCSYLFLFQSRGKFLRTIQALYAALYFVFEAFLLSRCFISALENDHIGAMSTFLSPSIFDDDSNRVERNKSARNRQLIHHNGATTCGSTTRHIIAFIDDA